LQGEGKNPAGNGYGQMEPEPVSGIYFFNPMPSRINGRIMDHDPVIGFILV